MKARTCPNCGNKTSLREYGKQLFRLLNSSWKCEKCGSQLTYNIGRRVVVAFVAMMPIGFRSIIASFLQLDFGISKGLSLAIFVLLFFVWAFFVFSFDSFELQTKKH